MENNAVDALASYLDTLASKTGAAPTPRATIVQSPPLPAPARAPAAGILRTIADMGVKSVQGAVDLGQSVVGVGSLATGGLAGKAMRKIGYDPEATNKALGEYLSPAQREAEQNLEGADGLVDDLVATVKNPRAIAGSVFQSLPGMLGIGGLTSAVARRIALRAAAPLGGIDSEAGAKAAAEAVKAAANKLLLTSTVADGAMSAGQAADQAQHDGRAYTDYALPALASGYAPAVTDLVNVIKAQP